MNLREFYANVRNTIAGIDEPFVVLVSKDTQDGGKAGVMTLAKRETAGRLIVEGRARLATDDETAIYFSDEKTKRDQADAERRFNSFRLGFNSGEGIEQYCQIQGEASPKPRSKA